jgi:hypothetical protein
MEPVARTDLQPWRPNKNQPTRDTFLRHRNWSKFNLGQPFLTEANAAQRRAGPGLSSEPRAGHRARPRWSATVPSFLKETLLSPQSVQPC